MSLLALTLTFGSALGWAGLDATRKGLVRHEDPAAAAFLITLGQALLFGGWAFYAGFEIHAQAWVDYFPYGIPALALQVAANLLLFWSLRLSPLSVTIPFLSLTPVFTGVVEYLLFHRHPTLAQAIGMALISFGAMRVPAGATAGTSPGLGALRTERGSQLAAVVAVLWSISGVLDSRAVVVVGLPTHAAVQTLGVTIGLGMWLVLRRDLSTLRIAKRSIPLAVGATLSGTLALWLQLWAIQLVLVGVVEGIKRALGMAAALLLGRFAFKESVGGRHVLAVGFMIAGVALLLLGGTPDA